MLSNDTFHQIESAILSYGRERFNAGYDLQAGNIEAYEAADVRAGEWLTKLGQMLCKLDDHICPTEQPENLPALPL